MDKPVTTKRKTPAIRKDIDAVEKSMRILSDQSVKLAERRKNLCAELEIALDQKYG